ncbi:MAG: hypothetical protein Q8O37_15475 [Sulfuricellaceae bacterium]|nr:hypothetical protein [Sulfuricellaceae bacterium]
MDLKQRLARIKRIDPAALLDAIPEQISREEIRERSESALRRHMKSQGRTDAEVDAYLSQSKGGKR